MWFAGRAKAIRWDFFLVCVYTIGQRDSVLISSSIPSWSHPYQLCLVLFFSSLIFFILRVLHSSVSWWFSIVIWKTASLIKSPELFLIFQPITRMLLFEWSPLVHVIQSLYQPIQDCTKHASFNCFHGHFHVLQFFFQLCSKIKVCISIFPFLQFYPVARQNGKVQYSAGSLFFFFFFFFWRLIVWPRLDDPFYLKIPKNFVCSFSRTDCA